MLSIIVASNRDKKFSVLRDNLFANASADYEFVRIENVGQGLSACFNQGAKQASFPYLCFVHDDVLFQTKAWPKKIIEKLRDEKTGVIGVMGSRYKSGFGTGWRDGEWTSFRLNVIDEESGNHLLYNPYNERQSETVCLDGAFLCCTKEHWQQHPFDEQTFTGFHFYDVDICLQMHKAGLKNYVMFDVALAHASQGRKDAAFLRDYLLFQAKWCSDLPVTLETISLNQQVQFEGYSLAQTLQLMKRNGFSKKERRKQISLYWRLYKNWYHVLRSVYFGFF